MTFKKKPIPNVEEAGMYGNTEAWNIAQYFTGYSIALPLKDINDLEDIARFGSVKLDEEFIMPEDQIAKRRSDAVKRYWQKLRQIVADTLFKVKSSDKAKSLEIHEWIKTIPKYFDALLELKSDNITHVEIICVNEKFLELLLNKLVEKKEEYLHILNRAGLIFRESDEVNLDAMTSEFIHGG